MSSKFGQLTQAQQAQFKQRIEVVGARLEDALATCVATTRGTTIISTDLQKSVIAPRLVVVRDVLALKTLGGVPDAHYHAPGNNDHHVRYPSPWDPKNDRLIGAARSVRELKALLGDERVEQVRQALHAWIMGDSQKVEAYRAIIDAVHFPQYSAVFALENICVKAGTVVQIGDQGESVAATYSLTVGTVCIEDTGQLQFLVPTNLNAQVLQKVPAGACNC